MNEMDLPVYAVAYDVSKDRMRCLPVRYTLRQAQQEAWRMDRLKPGRKHFVTYHPAATDGRKECKQS